MSFRERDLPPEGLAYICGTAMCRSSTDHVDECQPPPHCPACGHRDCYQQLIEILNASCSPGTLERHIQACDERAARWR